MISINKKITFSKKNPPIIIAEISGNHNGNKKRFLNLINSAYDNGADIVKIQTYEPGDITLNKKIIFLKLKKEYGKINIYGIFILKHIHLFYGTMMLLNWQRKKIKFSLVLRSALGLWIFWKNLEYKFIKFHHLKLQILN